MNSGGMFGTLVLRPGFWQWVVDKLPWIAINVIGYLWAIQDGMTLVMWLMIAMSVHLLYQLLYLMMIRYTISDEVIIYEHGVFMRQKEYIELYRVIDFRESVSFMQNLLDLKTVTVYSGDRTTPKLRIHGIYIGLQLVPHMRQRVEYNRRRKGIYEITNR